MISGAIDRDATSRHDSYPLVDTVGVLFEGNILNTKDHEARISRRIYPGRIATECDFRLARWSRIVSAR